MLPSDQGAEWKGQIEELLHFCIFLLLYLHILYCPYAKNLFAFIIQYIPILSCIPDLSFYFHPLLSLHYVFAWVSLQDIIRFQVQEYLNLVL